MLNELAFVRLAITVHHGGVVRLARMAIESKQAQGHSQQRRDSLHARCVDHLSLPACWLWWAHGCARRCCWDFVFVGRVSLIPRMDLHPPLHRAQKQQSQPLRGWLSA
jgi:hypothetical protein